MAISNTVSAGLGDDLQPGDRVGGGRFLLKRPLGKGTTSEVWLAQDVTGSRTAAMKFFPRAFLMDANLVEQLKQIARRHLKLKHPHIAETYELVCDATTMALAEEYVEGWSLATLKVDRLCSCYQVEEIEGWIGQLCATLGYAHDELGIVHSDIKPANLLLTAQEQLKVTDFEIAAIVRKECTRRGLAKGLYSGLGYLSPQQVMGNEPSKLDDIYSLGATIFDLLTGTPPFYKGEVFAQICGMKAPSMTERIRELEIQDEPISPVWEDTVARCLDKNPKDRPQSVLEVSGLLKRDSVDKPAEPAKEIPAAPVEINSPEAEKSPEVETTEISAPESIVEATIEPEKAAAVAEVVIVPAATPPTPTATVQSATPSVAAPGVAMPSQSHLPLILGGFALLAAVIGVAAVVAFKSLKQDAAVAHPANGTNAVAALAPGAPGSADTNFNIADGVDGEVREMLIQPDGKILAAGRFMSFNGTAHKNIVRLNPDGSIDDSFGFQGVGPIRALALQGDGGIFVAGDAMLKGHPRDHIMRLDADGGVDKSFNYGTKLNFEIRAVALEADGGVIAGGNFTQVNGNEQDRLMKFGPDGTPDGDFDANAFTSATVLALAVQPDGKILVGGSFTQCNNTDAGRMVRLNVNGTLDRHFNTGTGADGNIAAIAVQRDGAILIAGSFNKVNGQPCGHLARLNPDGTVDVTFAIGAGADKNVRDLAVQPDGKIVVVGEFTSFENVLCHYIVRLNPDGSVDKSFDTGTGASNVIGCEALQADGKIVLGGTFTSFNGENHAGMVRLNGTAAHQ